MYLSAQIVNPNRLLAYNNNNSKTMFMVLSSWQSHCESSPCSFDECKIAPTGCPPKTKPDDLSCKAARVYTHHYHLLLLLSMWPWNNQCPDRVTLQRINLISLTSIQCKYNSGDRFPCGVMHCTFSCLIYIHVNSYNY